MAYAQPKGFVSEEEYLQGENLTVRIVMVCGGGEVYAMVGASDRH